MTEAAEAPPVPAVEAQAIIAPEATTPVEVTPAEVAPVVVAQAGEAPEGETPMAMAPMAMALAAMAPAAKTPEAAMNHLTTTRVTTLSHAGMEVTLHPHDEQRPRRDMTGSSSTPPGGELKPQDHDLEPPGKDYRKRATTRFANVFTRPSRTRPATCYGAHLRHLGRTRT